MASNLGIAAYAGKFNENDEFTPESSGAIKTEMSHQELDKMIFETDTFEQAYDLLMENGASAYISINSNIITYSAKEGMVLFIKNGSTQDKIVLDQELSPEVALQLQSAKDSKEIEKILIENKLVKSPTEEMDRETMDKHGQIEVDRADRVDKEDELQPAGAISQNRTANAGDRMHREQREVEGMDR